MLYYNDRVTQVSQFFQRVYQTQVVALMQTDTGLVEDIKHIDQLRTNLCSQTDTLAFSSRQADRRTVEGQIIQSYIEQELQTRTDFLQDFSCNNLLLTLQMSIYLHQPFVQFADVHRCKLINVFIVNTEIERFLVQACTLTFRTNVCLCKLVGPLLCGSRCIFVLHQLNVFHNSIVCHKIIGRCMDETAFYFQTLIGAVQDIIDGIFGQFGYRSFQGCIVLLQQSLQLPEYHGILIFP